MSDVRRGTVMAFGAYLMWGFLPLYWPLLRPASSLEILAHRIVWSVVFFGGLVLGFRRTAELRGLGRQRLRLLALGACVVGVNWGAYIWGVTNGHVVETALGYFINPLVTVLLGVVLLGEHLSRARWIAAMLFGVAILTLTIDYGHPPWLSLVLAATFAGYGFIKKKAGASAIEGMLVETCVLVIPAAVYLGSLEAHGTATFGHVRGSTTVLLALSGAITGVPLLAFAGAANRIPLRTLGAVQYVSPTLQFLIGVFVFREPMPASRWVGFGIVWAALVVFVADGLLRSPPTVSATPAPATHRDAG